MIVFLTAHCRHPLFNPRLWAQASLSLLLGGGLLVIAPAAPNAADAQDFLSKPAPDGNVLTQDYPAATPPVTDTPVNTPADTLVAPPDTAQPTARETYKYKWTRPERVWPAVRKTAAPQQPH